jgi:arabinogalactan oligomer/maltooligosaccharide transport system permease protein
MTISKQRVKLITGDVFRYLLLTLMAIIWLIPVAYLVFTSFSKSTGLNYSNFLPKERSFDQYYKMLFTSNSVINFPRRFLNTLIVATFTCIISTLFILGVSYAMSKTRFIGRKFMMNLSMILGLFPGFLSMICIYFILKAMNIQGTLYALIIVYSASSGLGYLIAKGFFDTIPNSLIEAAKVDGASQAYIFFKIVMPLSKPIIVYTIITSFLGPWCDFVFARIILTSGYVDGYTVSIGLYSMLTKDLLGKYFTQFCAGSVIVSIPISILFVMTQKFYVEGITGGSVKG